MVQKPVVKVIFAAVVMGAVGITLFGTAIWALSFDGSLSSNLRETLHGHSMTTFGSVLLAVGIALTVSAGGVLAGSKLARWVGSVIGAVVAISGLWFVAYYPVWAITYTILGVVAVYALTLYDRELGPA